MMQIDMFFFFGNTKAMPMYFMSFKVRYDDKEGSRAMEWNVETSDFHQGTVMSNDVMVTSSTATTNTTNNGAQGFKRLSIGL